jgi:hypothetical protein
MSWQMYEIDRTAHDLVLQFRDRDVLPESHKMRAATAYGLERFWGEHLRLSKGEQDKSEFWKATWDEFCRMMKQAGIKIPNEKVSLSDTSSIQAMSKELWAFDVDQRKVALTILTELCDSLVWWTQRYRKPKSKGKKGC